MVLTRDGAVLGALPPLSLPVPWWPEMQDLVAAVHEEFGIDVTVLRLLRSPSDRLWGGAVAYLAETGDDPAVPLVPWPGDPLADEPLRQDWARPGGPAALLRWADERLAERGIDVAGRPEQMRSWNLSGIWRLPTTSGPVWLKAVPSFFAHEGAVIDWIGPGTGPRLQGHATGRVLMAEIEGEPNHGTRGAALEPMVELLTALQARCVPCTGELLALGVPDRRLAAMQPRIEAVVADHSLSLEPGDRRVLESLVEALPVRLAEIEACAVPDTLVHGDFHPGNVGGTPDRYVILDWGDSFVGNPLIDELAFTQRLDPVDRAAARGWFLGAWQRMAPTSDPERAADLLRPVLPLLAAVMYDGFCSGIEPDERVYHASDLVSMLQQAAAEGSQP